MRIRIFQVDAFADKLFAGNPAAICPLDHWPEDDLLQKIAMENNLPETAFFVLHERPLHIRWFTPATEVELCGHATLASAHVLNHHLEYRENPIQFHSTSGPLQVIVEGEGMYTLDFPQDGLRKRNLDHPCVSLFGLKVLELWRGNTDYLLLLESADAVNNAEPNLPELAKGDGRGYIITAPGNDVDYVSRCFYPQTGIDEDPATGSSHTTLAPFWAQRLGKKKFTARQLSARGAYFETEWIADRVLITGKAVSYLEGVIEV
ncbi:MAG TPA: PhzF family phenazine biosynthesis protein [Saprospiraceae bacterium]|nr:PhzF family phenazine biosynthesis protein [Saprospiraceae bacterium]